MLFFLNFLVTLKSFDPSDVHSEKILIPLIPKIRSMSEGTIWLSGD